MPLHCAAIGPKFLNVLSFSFSKPCDRLTLEILSVWGQLINYAWVKSYGRVGLLMVLNDL